jgi:hypothetical protein
MKLKHPDTKQTVDVREDQIDLYATQGWQPVGSKSDKGDDKGK